MIDLVNGDWQSMDPSMRRGLLVVADEVDGLHDDNRRLRRQIDDLRRTVMTVGGSVATILVASAIGVFFTQ